MLATLPKHQGATSNLRVPKERNPPQILGVDCISKWLCYRSNVIIRIHQPFLWVEILARTHKTIVSCLTHSHLGLRSNTDMLHYIAVHCTDRMALYSSTAHCAAVQCHDWSKRFMSQLKCVRIQKNLNCAPHFLVDGFSYALKRLEKVQTAVK